MAEQMSQKWHGSIEVTINAPVDKAWSIAGNFCALNKWVKTNQVCEKVEGEYQQPGCVRYVAGNSFNRPDGQLSWAKEKILSIDEANHTLTYAMLDNNFGLDGYKATFKLKDLGNGMSLVNWSYEVNPVENRTEEMQTQFMTTAWKKALDALEEQVGSQSRLQSN